MAPKMSHLPLNGNFSLLTSEERSFILLHFAPPPTFWFTSTNILPSALSVQKTNWWNEKESAGMVTRRLLLPLANLQKFSSIFSPSLIPLRAIYTRKRAYNIFCSLARLASVSVEFCGNIDLITLWYSTYKFKYY